MTARQPVQDRIESLHVKGFRSLADLQLDDIPNPMVLLGANGAGKSNILRFLTMLKEMFQYRLGDFVQQQGGADDQLFGGRRSTRRIEAVVAFRTAGERSSFSFILEHRNPDRFTVADEVFRSENYISEHPSSSTESDFLHRTRSSVVPTKEPEMAADMLGDFLFYQFHDTSDAAPIKTTWDAQDNHRLLEHGGNLAPVLLHLRENDFARYNLICRHIRRILPEFDGFEIGVDYGKCLLRWRAHPSPHF